MIELKIIQLKIIHSLLRNEFLNKYPFFQLLYSYVENFPGAEKTNSDYLLTSY